MYLVGGLWQIGQIGRDEEKDAKMQSLHKTLDTYINIYIETPCSCLRLSTANITYITLPSKVEYCCMEIQHYTGS